MVNSFYRIADVIIQVEAPFPIQDTALSEPFVCAPTKADLRCLCTVEKEFLKYDFPVLLREPTITAQRLENTIIRNHTNHLTGDIFLQSVQEMDKPEQIHLYYKKSELSWLSLSTFLWDAMDIRHHLLVRDRLILHAAFVHTEYGAILFSAPSGTGKSTQAALWQQNRGAEIINGDKVVLSFQKKTILAHSLPIAGTSHICNNKTLPLKGIVLLKQSLMDGNLLRELHGFELISQLYPNCVIDTYLDEDRDKALYFLSKIASSIKIWELECTPDERAVEVLESVLEGL